MGQVNAFEELKLDNPTTSEVQLRMYADAMQSYCEAASNVRKNGAVVAHPRTGSPIDNPCLKVLTSRFLILSKMKHIKGDRVMRLLEEANK